MVCVTVLLHDDVHPFASVSVTVYFPCAVTVKQLDVEPLLHRYEYPAGAHNSTVLPGQM